MRLCIPVRHQIAFLALAAASFWSTAAYADGPSSKPKPGAGSSHREAGSEAKHESMELKSVHLQHMEPQEVQSLLSQLWPQLNGRQKSQLIMPRIAVNGRNKTIYLRGTKRSIEMASALLETLDGDPSKDSEDHESLTLVRLHHARVEEVSQVLSSLGFQGVVPLSQLNSLALIKTGENAQEIQDLIKELDTKAPSTKKTQNQQPKTQTGRAGR